ncbi:MAG: PAAR domain-containing protein [Ferruginibacter sp.]|nr:PAAR domain-containing protein [Chitinophagaceae bacterium]
MSKPAARVGDLHVCPMVTPGLPPVPHVGGPIVGPGCATVLIGGMPAAVMGDTCTCVGPPDAIVLGSIGVLIGGKPAARMGDSCAHGGMITIGFPTVLIGETSASMAALPMPVLQAIAAIPGPAQVAVMQVVNMVQAAETGDPLVHNALTCSICAQNSSHNS